MLAGCIDEDTGEVQLGPNLVRFGHETCLASINCMSQTKLESEIYSSQRKLVSY